nr:amidohydrolase family protein [Hyphomonas sp.]
MRRPDDWHVHLRDGALLASVVGYTARQFARAIVMPNLSPPITTVAAAAAYRDRILAALEPGVVFTPLMTCYLTDTIEAGEVERGFAEGVFTACKLYPAHATTNSDHGVTDIRKIYPVLEAMERIGMPLLLHGEVTDRHVDIFDREAVFIDRILTKLIADFPGLKVVFEHITTADAVSLRRSRWSKCRSHDNAAPSGDQSQRHVRRRDPPSFLLLADREAGGPSARIACGRNIRFGEILPRHRLSTARGQRQGVRVRVRRHIQCALCSGKLCACV